MFFFIWIERNAKSNKSKAQKRTPNTNLKESYDSKKSKLWEN